MPRQDDRRTRLRIDRTAVKEQAVKGASGRGSQTLALPEGVAQWQPDKEQEYALRFLPYQITTPNHRDERAIGTLWYRFPYAVHFSVAGTDKAVVCPRTFGQKCPICEEVHTLYQEQGTTEKNKKTIDNISAKKMCLFAAIGVENAPGEVFVFAWNESKFAEWLEKKLKKVKADDAGFADVEDGRIVRFAIEMRPSWGPGGKPFLATEAGSISFEDAGELANLSDELLATVPDLGKLVHDKLLSYEQIDALFRGNAEPADDTPPVTGAEKEERAAALAPEIPEGAVSCKACNGTGKASSGRACLPCGGKGFIMPKTSAAPTPPPPTAGSPAKASTAPAAPKSPPAPPSTANKARPTAAAAPEAAPLDEKW